MIRGILILPSEGVVREVELPNNVHDNWNPISNLLDCGYLARAPVTADRRDALWFDEDGGDKDDHPYGYFQMLGLQFAGRGLILGMDRKENAIDTSLTPAEVLSMIRFGRSLPPDEDAWLRGPWIKVYNVKEDGTFDLWKAVIEQQSREVTVESADPVAI